jgi:hypothetical protein
LRPGENFIRYCVLVIRKSARNIGAHDLHQELPFFDFIPETGVDLDDAPGGDRDIPRNIGADYASYIERAKGCASTTGN